MAVPGECNDNFNGKIAGEEKYANAGQMQKGNFLIRPFSIIIAVLAVSVFVASIFIINPELFTV